nr:MAG TPA: hypothetical protein [Caudoviricetes sp.]
MSYERRRRAKNSLHLTTTDYNESCSDYNVVGL